MEKMIWWPVTCLSLSLGDNKSIFKSMMACYGSMLVIFLLQLIQNKTMVQMFLKGHPTKSRPLCCNFFQSPRPDATDPMGDYLTSIEDVNDMDNWNTFA